MIKSKKIVWRDRQPKPYNPNKNYYWIRVKSKERESSNRFPAEIYSREFCLGKSFLETRGGKMNRKAKWVIFGAIVLTLTFFGFISLSYGASKDKEKEVKVETKTITGEVGGIGRKFISIIYKKEQGTDYELAIRVPEDVKLVRKKSFKSIAAGDTVRVEYKEATQDYEELQPDGSVEKKTKIISRTATKITFMRPSTSSLRSGR
jgi:hypothetical protein